MEDGNYFGDNQLLGLASILQQLHAQKEALIGGVGVYWGGGWREWGRDTHQWFQQECENTIFCDKVAPG